MRRPLLLLVAGVASVLIAASCGPSKSHSGIPPGTSIPPSPTNGPSPTPQLYGDGHLGSKVVATVETAATACFPLISASGAAATVGGAPAFAAGDAALLVQMQADVAVSTTNQAGQIGTIGSAGLWEFALVSTANGASLVLGTNLAGTYRSAGASRAQICWVPEYASLTIAQGGSLVPRAWNGTAGGIVAALVLDTLDIAGSIDASHAGFRRGEARTTYVSCGDVAADSAVGGRKGEGLDGNSLGATGRGARGNAAGGGVAGGGGGGGGSGGGAGGIGGSAGVSCVAPGGIGGRALPADRAHLFAGGGGGGGAPESSGTATGPGAAGGGIVVVRAHVLTNAGTFAANGADAPSSTDASGGGGGGGTIYVLVGANTMFSGTFSATGGAGGSNVSPNGYGGGGGGGGGRLIRVGTLNGVVTLTGGAAGVGTGTVSPGAGGIGTVTP